MIFSLMFVLPKSGIPRILNDDSMFEALSAVTVAT
jgi:hypothetical protein